MASTAVEVAKASKHLPPPRLRRLLREESGVSQLQIAQDLGVSKTAVSYWEAGRRTPRGDLLIAYVALLQNLREISEGGPHAAT